MAADYTHHIAAAQAAGADVHTLRRTVDHHADTLHVGRPGTVGLTVGVADVVAVQRTLFADLAKLTHGNPPPCWSMHTSSLDSISYSAAKSKGFPQKFSIWKSASMGW